MDLAFIAHVFPRLLAGLPLTMLLAVLALTGGAVLALLLSGLRASSWFGARCTDFYVYIFRGTPLLIQIFLIYYGLAQFAVIRHSILWPLLREPTVCAVLALMLNDAAYTTEILRGGLRAVPQGAIEAAKVAGMTRAAMLRRIVLPLAIRQALPAYGVEITSMVKATSLASVVTLMEVTGIARAEVSESYRAIEVFLCAAVIYLVLVSVITRIVHGLETWLSPYRRPVMARSAA